MTTIFLENQVEGCPQYVKVDPYQDATDKTKYYVSVGANSTYDNTLVALGTNAGSTAYNLTNDLFAQFLVDEVFEIYGNKDATTITPFTTGYIKDTTSTPTYIKPAQIIVSTEDGATATGTHLAGTLLTFKIDNATAGMQTNLNCALLIDETFKTDGNTISKVDVNLRYTEALMQTLYGTSGNVYDFKKAVKISDFEGNLEHLKAKDSNNNDVEGYRQGFPQFRMIEPTNMSISKDITFTATAPTIPTIVDGSGESLYDTDSTAPGAAPDPSSTTFDTDEYTASTNFTGYFIMCCFADDVSGIQTIYDDDEKTDDEKKAEVKNLLGKKPYLTILRIVNSKVVNTQFNQIFHIDESATISYTNNCILNYAANYTDSDSNAKALVEINIGNIGIYLPLDLMLYRSESLDNPTLVGSFYILDSMKKTE